MYEEKIRRQRVRDAVSLCGLYGIVSVSLQLFTSLITTNAAGNYIVFYIVDMIASVLFSLVPALVLAHMGKGLKNYLRTPKHRKVRIFDSVLLVIMGLSGCLTANMICTILDSYLPDVSHKIYISFESTPGNFLLALTASAVIPAICEEIACRGYLYGTLAPYGHLSAVIISSLIFGMLHSSFNTVLFAFLCGMIMGCIRKSSNRFELCVIVHFLNNALSTVCVFIRMNHGRKFYADFLRLSSQTALLLFGFCLWLLYKRRVRVFSFRKCPYPLRRRDKLLAVVTSPVLWLFIAAAIIVKFL